MVSLFCIYIYIAIYLYIYTYTYVCVWTIWKDVKLPLFRWWLFFVVFAFELYLQGAQAHCGYLCQRSYSTMGEAEIDHLRVPAPIFISVHGNRPSPEPACRFVFNVFSALLPQSAYSTIFMIEKAASEPSSEQGRRKFTSYWNSRWINKFSWQFFKGLFCAREMHSTTKFALLFLSKCVIPAVYVKLAGTLRGKPFQANNWQ